MTGKDEDKVGIAASWSWEGVQASIKSRFLSAADSLGASWLKSKAVNNERTVAIKSASTQSMVALIEAATKAVGDQIKDDPEAAARLLRAVHKAGKQGENLEATMAYAVEEIASSTADDRIEAEGPSELSTHFLSHYEQFAERASDELAREKWGKVLASEIMKPGTFSAKMLRLIDELEGSPAVPLFTDICKFRIAGFIPSALAPLSRADAMTLEEADLLRPNDLGLLQVLFRSTLEGGEKCWVACWERYGVGIMETPPPKIKVGSPNALLSNDGDNLAFEIHPLTSVGRAIASLNPYNELEVVKALRQAFVADNPPGVRIFLVKRNEDHFITISDSDDPI